VVGSRSTTDAIADDQLFQSGEMNRTLAAVQLSKPVPVSMTTVLPVIGPVAGSIFARLTTASRMLICAFIEFFSTVTPPSSVAVTVSVIVYTPVLGSCATR